MPKSSEEKSKLRTVVFCPGPMGIFEQSLALQERGWLQTMATDYYCDLSSFPYRWIPDGRIKRYLRKRYNPDLDGSQVRLRPLPSMVNRIGSRTTTRIVNRNRWVFWHNDQFDRW